MPSFFIPGESYDQLEDGEIPQDQKWECYFGGRAAFLGTRWGYGNQVIFFDESKSKSVPAHGQTPLTDSSSRNNFEVKEWGIYDREVRTLLLGWHSIFDHMQKHSKHPDQLHSYSRKYRAELMALISRCMAEVEEQELKGGMFAEQARSSLGIFQKCYIIWHLCEIFWIDPSANVTAQMIDWLQQTVPRESTENVRQNSAEYWNILIRMVLNGRTEDVVMELNKNAQIFTESEDELNLVVDLLRTIPSIGSTNRAPGDFLKDFRYWKGKVHRYRSDIRAQGLLDILDILQGDLSKLEDFSQDGYQLLVFL